MKHLLLLSGLLLLLAACKDSDTIHCKTNKDCPSGQECVVNQCWPAGDITRDTSVGDGAVDIAADTEPLEDTEEPQDTEADTTLPDTKPADTGAEDTTPPDTGPEDTGPEDTGPADTGAEDTGPEDTGADTEPVDTEPDVQPDTVDSSDASTCINDEYDNASPNETAATATPLDGEQFEASGLRLCEQEEDWYSVTMAAGQYIWVAFQLEQGSGVLIAELVGPDQTTVLDNTRSDDPLPGLHAPAVAEGGSYYIRVRAETGNAELSYFMSLSIASSSCSDIYEENDTPLTAPNMSAGRYEDLELCPLDEDWFYITVPDNWLLQVQIAYSGSPTNLGLQIYDTDTTTLLMEDVNFDPPQLEQLRELSITPSDIHVYYIRVFRHDPPATTDTIQYLLDLNVVFP